MAEQTPTSFPVPGPLAGSPPPGARKARPGTMPSELWNAFGEEFRSLRTRVAATLNERHKIVLVTSSLPQEGKSTVSSTLARSFAQLEWKTLLVDADLRKPSLHAIFGIDRAPGLTDLLQGRMAETDAIAASDSPFLDLLSAGAPSDSPAELLHSNAAPDLLRGLAARYEYVVVDSPPLTSITDTLLLSGYVDGILFVVRGRVSPRELVKTAREQLHDRPVLGVVLNGISTPRKYGYYY
jgi:capsular exopolysaccharide synthesis family protein